MAAAPITLQVGEFEDAPASSSAVHLDAGEFEDAPAQKVYEYGATGVTGMRSSMPQGPVAGSGTLGTPTPPPAPSRVLTPTLTYRAGLNNDINAQPGQPEYERINRGIAHQQSQQFEDELGAAKDVGGVNAAETYGSGVAATAKGTVGLVKSRGQDPAARAQVFRGVAQQIAGGGSMAFTLGAPEMMGIAGSALSGDAVAKVALAKIIAGFAAGAGASKGADAVAEKYQFTPEARELLTTVAFFVPSLMGAAAGVKSGVSTTPEGDPAAAASAFGGRVGVGAVKTPEAYEVRAGVRGGPSVGVRIPRGGQPQAPPEPAQIAAAATQAAATDAVTQAAAVSKAAENIVNGVKPTPPPAPPMPRGMDSGQLTPKTVATMAEVIKAAPQAMQGAMLLEAHKNLAAWILKTGQYVGPDGKVQIADTPQKASTLAQQVINDETDRHARAAEDQQKQQADIAKQVEKETAKQQKDAEKQAKEQQKIMETPNENGLTPAEVQYQRAKTLIESSTSPAQASANIMRSLNVTRDQAQALIQQHQTEQAIGKAPDVGSKAEPTKEESRETVDAQVAALARGEIPVVMLPEGSKYRPTVPPGMKILGVKGDMPGAGLYIYDPSRVNAKTIKEAAKAGTHGDLLGHLQDKTTLADGQPTVVVQAHTPDGTPIQDSQVHAEPEMVHTQAEILHERHPEAHISVKTPEQVLMERGEHAPVELEPGEFEESPDKSEQVRRGLDDFMTRVGTRLAAESHGQDILDKMDEAGESPRDVSKQFWEHTYFGMPAEAQRVMQKQLRAVTGMQPGDTLYTKRNAAGEVESFPAKDWADIADGAFPAKVEHLEGGERGLVAMMRVANDKFGTKSNPQEGQHAVQIEGAGALGTHIGGDEGAGRSAERAGVGADDRPIEAAGQGSTKEEVANSGRKGGRGESPELAAGSSPEPAPAAESSPAPLDAVPESDRHQLIHVPRENAPAEVQEWDHDEAKKWLGGKPSLTIASSTEEELDPKTLKTTQGWASGHKLDQWTQAGASPEQMPRIDVVRTPDGDYIVDGVHRASMAARAGQKVPATVYTVKGEEKPKQEVTPASKGDRVAFTDRNGVEREGTIAFKGERVARIKDEQGRSYDNVPVASIGEHRAQLQPGESGPVALSSLNLDPKRFQYKVSGIGAEGVSDLLTGKKWNEDLAGVISVWRDPADGKLYVVNGHHRVTLAKQTGAKTMLVRMLKANDAVEARSIGALQNIADGRGTPIDAAKFLRDSGITLEDLDAKGISMGEATAQNGVALSRLDTRLFDMVVQGKMGQGRGIAIGRETGDAATQDAILTLIEKAEKRGVKVNDGTVEELARFAQTAPLRQETVASLFGDQQQTESTALDKAAVSAYVKRQLGTEKRVFGAVASERTAKTLAAEGKNRIDAKGNAAKATDAEQALAVYDKLSARRGAIDDILNRAAEERANAKPSEVGGVDQRAYEAVRAALSEALPGGESPGADGIQAAADSAEREPGEHDKVAAPALPGMEDAVRKQDESAAEVKADTQRDEVKASLTTPKADISKAAGEMERNSPLFHDSEASGQGGLFASGAETTYLHSGLPFPSAVLKPLAQIKPVADVLALIGDEADRVAVSRDLHNRLYDMQSQDNADVLRVVQMLKAMPGTAKDQQAIYHHLEDPKANPLTAEQEDILDNYLTPLIYQAEQDFQVVSEGGVPLDNYVHRQVRDKGGMIDRIMERVKEGKQGGNGVPSGRLSKTAPAAKHRTMMAIERVSSANGNPGERQVVAVKGGRVTVFKRGQPGKDMGSLASGITSLGAQVDKDMLPYVEKVTELRKQLAETKGQKTLEGIPRGTKVSRLEEALKDAEAARDHFLNEYPTEKLADKVWKDRNGDLWKITQATTKEIEANTDLRYYHNAAGSVAVNYLTMAKARRAYEFLEEFKRSPEFLENSHSLQSPGAIPKGWKATQLPQFRGYFFEPHIAEVLDMYAKRAAHDPGVLEKVGNFLRTSIFFNPLIHIPNLLNHWVVEKGVSGFANPMNYPRMTRAGIKAINAVIHQNQDFLDALDHGAPLQSQQFETKQFADLFFKKMQDEIGDPENGKLKEMAAALGMSPVRLVQAIYKFSSKATWFTNDIAFLQATYEKQARGAGFKDALNETAKHIPDYRLMTRIFDSPHLGKVMNNRALTMFGAYHYGALKSYGQMMKSLGGFNWQDAGTRNERGEPTNAAGRTEDEEKVHGLDTLAMLALVTLVVYPLIDHLLRLVTHNDEAQMRRAGASTFIYNLAMLAKGEKTPTEVAESVATPAVGIKTAAELTFNRDLRTGQRLYNPHADWETMGGQIGRQLARSVAPVSQGMDVAEGRTDWKRLMYSMVGVSFPLHGAEKIAAQITAENLASLPVRSEKQIAHAITRSRALHDAWAGDRSKLDALMHSHDFTPKEKAKIRKDLLEPPIIYAVKPMPYDDALRVYKAADAHQKAQLRPVLTKKLARLIAEGKKPAGESVLKDEEQ